MACIRCGSEKIGAVMLRQTKLTDDGPLETVTPSFTCGNCGHTWPRPVPVVTKDVDPEAHGPKGIDHQPPKDDHEPTEEQPMPTASTPSPASEAPTVPAETKPPKAPKGRKPRGRR